MPRGGENGVDVRILGTGGFSYNRSVDLQHHVIYNTESFAGTCFCASTAAMKAVHMYDEMWLEKHGFAAWEDRVMISKLIVNGYRACVVSDASYEHNDGKTSVKKLRLEPIFARGFNHYLYWHRFLYKTARSGGRRAWSSTPSCARKRSSTASRSSPRRSGRTRRPRGHILRKTADRAVFLTAINSTNG